MYFGDSSSSFTPRVSTDEFIGTNRHQVLIRGDTLASRRKRFVTRQPLESDANLVADGTGASARSVCLPYLQSEEKVIMWRQ